MPNIKEGVLTIYNFYRPGTTTIEPRSNTDGYSLVYDEKYTKIRSIEGKESNRFNLIQTACEAFECWSHFRIFRNKVNGKIDIVDRYVLTKIVTQYLENNILLMMMKVDITYI